MYYVRWISDGEFLAFLMNGVASWGPQKEGKEFASRKEAEEYLQVRGGRAWSTEKVDVIYKHPLNLR